MGEFDKALEDLNKCIEISKESNANAYTHRAYLRYHTNKFNECIADINQSLTLDPDYKRGKEFFDQITFDFNQAIIQGIDIFCDKHHLFCPNDICHIITLLCLGEGYKNKPKNQKKIKNKNDNGTDVNNDNDNDSNDDSNNENNNNNESLDHSMHDNTDEMAVAMNVDT